MKKVLGFCLFLASVTTHASTCNLISGSFKTATTPCMYTHDGVDYYMESHKDINISYIEETKKLKIIMNVSTSPYTLNYIADSKERVGRDVYEGEKYTANCENNQILVRAEPSALRFPLLTEFSLLSENKLVYKSYFEGSTFVRVCEMERIR